MDKDDGSLANLLLHEESFPESNHGRTEQEKQTLQQEEKVNTPLHIKENNIS